jgi:uncharacterized membrane protein
MCLCLLGIHEICYFPLIILFQANYFLAAFKFSAALIICLYLVFVFIQNSNLIKTAIIKFGMETQLK